MEIEEIRALIKDMVALMQENDLSELELDSKGVKIRLKTGSGGNTTPVIATPEMGSVPASAPQTEAATQQEKKLMEIKSPLVGTFYQASGPDAEPFVEVGSMIEPDTTVCIIEAMKVMNEIKAEVEGKVVEVLVSNGEVVEFGQPLFLAEPSA